MGTILRDSAPKVTFFGSIQTKFLITYIFLVAVILLLLNTYPLIISRDLIYASKNTSLLNQASLIGVSVEGVDNLAADSISQVMSMLNTSDLDGVVITDSDALLLYDSRKGAATADTGVFEIGTTEAFAGNDWFSSSFRSGLFSSFAAVPIMRGDSIAGAVLVYQYDEEQGSIMISLQSNIMRVSALVTFSAILLSVLLARTLTSRMTRVLEAIETVREGEYSYRIDVTGHDEVTQLAAEFNSLTDRLQKTEEVRRRFVSDASHELKTPLASIRLLADSIVQSSEIDTDTMREFVGDIGNEAERLARTTEKLMSLTRLDNKIATVRERIDMAETVKRAVQLVRPLAVASSVAIYTELNDDCFIYASSDDVFQVALNILENAVKYNVYGGKVNVTLSKKDIDVIFSVEDTGIGIPEADMPHIFDRFYRVDKARARDAGGSGLGLSIVRSVVNEHRGTVVAERGRDNGMRFTVTFPYCPLSKKM